MTSGHWIGVRYWRQRHGDRWLVVLPDQRIPDDIAELVPDDARRYVATTAEPTHDLSAIPLPAHLAELEHSQAAPEPEWEATRDWRARCGDRVVTIRAGEPIPAAVADLVPAELPQADRPRRHAHRRRHGHARAARVPRPPPRTATEHTRADRRAAPMTELHIRDLVAEVGTRIGGSVEQLAWTIAGAPLDEPPPRPTPGPSSLALAPLLATELPPRPPQQQARRDRRRRGILADTFTTGITALARRR